MIQGEGQLILDGVFLSQRARKDCTQYAPFRLLPSLLPRFFLSSFLGFASLPNNSGYNPNWICTNFGIDIQNKRGSSNRASKM